MSKNPVIVAGDAHGNCITYSGNPEFAFVRVTQQIETFEHSGWLQERTLSALIHGKLETLVSKNFKVGQELPGNIIVHEQLEPINPDNLEIGLKRAGTDGMPCLVDDQPIYRKTFYTEQKDVEHVFIQHTNTVEIKEAFKAQKAENALKKVVRKPETAIL